MRRLFIYLLFLLVTACSSGHKNSHDTELPGTPPNLTESTGTHIPNEFRGYIRLNSLVKQRIASTENYELVDFLSEDPMSSEDKGALINLLGIKSADGRSQSLIEKQANPINTLLWSNLFYAMAGRIADSCIASGGGALEGLQPNVRLLILEFCNLSSLSAGSSVKLTSLYRLILAQDGTDVHFREWLALVLDRKDLFAKDRHQWIRLAIYSALFSPEFLISR